MTKKKAKQNQRTRGWLIQCTVLDSLYSRRMWHINHTNSSLCNPQKISAFPVEYGAWFWDNQLQFHKKVTIHSLEFKPLQKGMALPPPSEVSPLYHSLSLTFMPIPVSLPVHLPLPWLYHWQEFEGWGEKNILNQVCPEHDAFFSWMMHHTCFWRP